MSGDQFLGYALNAVDAKSRVSVPPSFRSVVEARSNDRKLVVGPSEYDDCLVCHDTAYSTKLRTELETRYAGDYSRERAQAFRRTFGRSTELGIDDGHRITLTPTLRDLSGIDRLVYFLGSGDYFELWNPHTLLASDGLDPQTARILRRELEAKGEVA